MHPGEEEEEKERAEPELRTNAPGGCLRTTAITFARRSDNNTRYAIFVIQIND